MIPLGNFNPKAPLNRDALYAASVLLNELPTIKKGLITRCYLHWTVASLCAEFSDYNVEAELVNDKHALRVTHDPRDNALNLNNNPPASHTWHRNTGAVGIAITGMDGATEHDFGQDGLTLEGLEYLCAGAATLCQAYGVDALGAVTDAPAPHADNLGRRITTKDEPNILTHAECAVYDDYRSERWDLGTLVALPAGIELTDAIRKQSGNALRERIHLYKQALNGGPRVDG